MELFTTLPAKIAAQASIDNAKLLEMSRERHALAKWCREAGVSQEDTDDVLKLWQFSAEHSRENGGRLHYGALDVTALQRALRAK